jgi:hypothetical protein
VPTVAVVIVLAVLLPLAAFSIGPVLVFRFALVLFLGV